MAILDQSADAFCACGSGKKYKRCHGSDSPPEPPPLEVNHSIDSALLCLAYSVLDLLKEAIASVTGIELADDNSNADDVFRKRTLLYFAKKVYRVTLAGITLARCGQTTQALTLKRDQHYARTAFLYYFEFPRESILFFASAPLRQRDSSRKIMDFNPEAKNDKRRQKQLADLEGQCDMLYKLYPDLKVIRKKSDKGPNPEYRDWKEKDEHDMFAELVRKWPEEMAKMGHPIPEDEQEAWIARQVASGHFFHATYPGQDIHNTPMGLIFDLNAEGDEPNSNLNLNIHDANAVTFLYLGYVVDVVEKLVDLSGASGFKDRIVKVKKAALIFQDHVAL